MSLKLAFLVILLIFKLSLSKDCRINHGQKLSQVVCSNLELHSDRKLIIPNERNLEKLIFKNITGNLDLANFTLENLRYIFVSHSKLDGFILGNFPKLIFLTFLKNHKIPNINKISATHIQWLSLITNHQTIEPHAFHLLPNLTWLHIQNQNLQTLTNNLFKQNPNLHELTIRNCNLSTINIDTFNGTPNLEILSLNFNKITNFQIGTFRNLKKLKILELHHNKLINLNLKQFQGLQNLEILGLPSVFLRRVNNTRQLIEVFPNLKKMEIKKQDLIRNKNLVKELRDLGIEIIGTPHDCHSKKICPII